MCDAAQATAAIDSQMTASFFSPILYVYSRQMKTILLLPDSKKKKRNPLTFVFTHPSRNSSSFVPFASKSFGFAPGEAETNIFRLSQESRTIGLEALREHVPFHFSFLIFFFFLKDGYLTSLFCSLSMKKTRSVLILPALLKGAQMEKP